MSLKAFHIVFILSSIVLAVGLVIWGWSQYINQKDVAALAISLIAFLSTGALIYYLWGFPGRFRKST